MLRFALFLELIPYMAKWHLDYGGAIITADTVHGYYRIAGNFCGENFHEFRKLEASYENVILENRAL